MYEVGKMYYLMSWVTNPRAFFDPASVYCLIPPPQTETEKQRSKRYILDNCIPFIVLGYIIPFDE